MSDNSAIEWTDATWNFLVGCSKVSAGCASCYAIRSVARMSGNPQFGERYRGLVTVGQKPLNWTGKVTFLPDKLTLPLGWKESRRIFVNSLSDLFHPSVPDDWIDDAFGVMALARQHTFQVLTKRPERMAAYFAERFQSWTVEGGIAWTDRSDRVFEAMQHFTDPKNDAHFDAEGNFIWPGWPLPNVWLGTSVEDQRAADERIPHLLATPAAVRFLSCEPLLGPVDLSRICLGKEAGQIGDFNQYIDALKPAHVDSMGFERRLKHGIGWVISGGESGPHARPMHPDWARSLRDQCQAAGVAYFMKQWGEYLGGEVRIDEDGYVRAYHQDGSGPDGHQGKPDHWWRPVDTRRPDLPGLISTRVGKKAAGRLLDGRTWDEFPQPAGVPATVG